MKILRGYCMRGLTARRKKLGRRQSGDWGDWFCLQNFLLTNRKVEVWGYDDRSGRT